MTRTLTLLATLAFVLAGLVPAAAQTRPPTYEAIHLARRLEAVRDRIPKEATETLEARILRWESANWDQRMYVEKCILAFESMIPHQVRSLFQDALAAAEDQRLPKVKEVLDRLAAGTEVEAPDVRPSAVVVIFGGDVTDPKIGFQDPKHANIPQIWNEIRPFGAVAQFKTMWPGQRAMWIGECLTGISVNSIVPDGNVFKFRFPTVCDLFRKASGATARDCWVVDRAEENVIFDYLDFARDFEDRYSPIAITKVKLVSVDKYVQDHILSQRKEGKTAFEIQRELKSILTPGKLHLDVDIKNPEVQGFLKDVVAEHGGQVCDSDAFIMRLGVRLLRDPVQAPRLAVFRFGGIPGINDVRRPTDKRAMMVTKMRDDDEMVFNLWRAFRENPYYKRFGTFIAVSEYGGAVFVGPKILPGEPGKSFYLSQFAATLAALLGYDPEAFLGPSAGNPKKTPVKEILEDG